MARVLVHQHSTRSIPAASQSCRSIEAWISSCRSHHLAPHCTMHYALLSLSACHVLYVDQITLRLLYYMSQFGPRLNSSTMLDFSPCLAFYHRPPLAKAPISVNGHSSEPPLGFASKFACFVSRRRPHYSVCNGNGPIPAWVSSPTHFHHRKPQDDLECSSYYQKSFQPDLP